MFNIAATVTLHGRRLKMYTGAQALVHPKNSLVQLTQKPIQPQGHEAPTRGGEGIVSLLHQLFTMKAGHLKSCVIKMHLLMPQPVTPSPLGHLCLLP